VKKFIIFVIDDRSNSGTEEEMHTIDIFNEKLQSEGHWIFAGGLSAPSEGNVIDNRGGVNIETGKPLFAETINFSGFWLINAEDEAQAKQLAFEGSQACNRKVELRPLLG
jgi:hypothetical protein